jgi:hypothetical protein
MSQANIEILVFMLLGIKSCQSDWEAECKAGQMT